MADFVLDSSIALAWCFPDEVTPGTKSILARLGSQIAIVPSLWYLEIANILSLAMRKGRIDEKRLVEFLREITSLPIYTDEETVAHALTDTLLLSRHCELTAYDAAYIELAQRLDIPLASKDQRLCQAAKKLKIALIEAA